MSKTDNPQYYAIPDPLDPGKVSYWYRPAKGRDEGRIVSWPPRRSRWGSLAHRDVPHDKKTDRDGYSAFVRAYFLKVHAAHGLAVKAIDANPGTAAARFAAFTVRCCHCGKTLTDERSKVYGIGPECRTGVDPDRLAAAMEAVRAAHAETLARVEVRP